MKVSFITQPDLLIKIFAGCMLSKKPHGVISSEE